MKLLRRVTYSDGDTGVHLGPFLRRLTLRAGNVVFLDRWAIETKWFGVYLHRLTGPDPGRDVHSHPWPFRSIVLRGGYTEEVASAEHATELAKFAEVMGDLPGVRVTRGTPHTHRRFSTHVMPLDKAHRITHVEPRTVTLVIRGRKQPTWGFYTPDGWVDQVDYDYTSRRNAG